MDAIEPSDAALRSVNVHDGADLSFPLLLVPFTAGLDAIVGGGPQSTALSVSDTAVMSVIVSEGLVEEA
jgi:hypothetical protein